ncbi:MAG: DEAD/DEAH box helicase [Elusimicrobiaceae bacterium]|nr:DEAD/DEAH box helicase [Elusimicrobiaceae bacterium]
MDEPERTGGGCIGRIIMNLFETLPDFLQKALKRMLITAPTPVQTRAIPPALEGKDVLATAQTGTGKTFAFLLPMVVYLFKNPTENALILSPTRELAQQIQEELEKLLDEEHSFQTALIIGGDNIHKQYADLRKHPRVIIATPGRLIDHIGRKSVNLIATHFLVLDETDRMLDMGFIDDMRRVVALLGPKRQTLLFSATLPKEIVALAGEFLTAPVRIKVGETVAAGAQVLQEVVYLDIREKLPQLLHELNTRSGSVLIFTKTKHGAERLAKELKRYGQKANALHGELRQNRRRQVLSFFKDATVRVLVATDLAARGLDVTHIEHVINYDLPQCAEDYIHRVGRTGRAGAVGSAISFVTEPEKWKEICRVAKFSSPVKTIQKTIEPLPEPKFVAQEESAVRKKKSKPSAYTKRAKELLKEAQVELPQHSRPQTFRKATAAAHVLNEERSLSMRQMKKARPLPPQKTGKKNFAKFIGKKKHR